MTQMKHDDMDRMMKEEFMELMNFPREWATFHMYPDELFYEQLKTYNIENDDEGSEHYRNGAFHWWLKRNPSKEELIKLTHLTFLDYDQIMADDVRSYIIKSSSFDSGIEKLIKKSYIDRLYLAAKKRECM